MDTETFKAESSFHAAWLAWAVGGVLCPPESLLVRVPERKEPEPEKPDAKPSNETKPISEQVRRLQEHARQRLLEPPAGQDEPIEESKRKLH